MERRCGDCSLCCTLLPVVALGKRDGERCKHQRGLGCNIYRKEGFPGECALWSCRWLVDETTAGLLRPDIAHYVIDIIPDFVIGRGAAGEQRAAAIQVWIDPRFPDAHRDPGFRQWMTDHEPNCVALIRFSARDAIVLIPPQMSDTGDWEEIGGERSVINEIPHSAEEVANVLSQLGAMR